MVMVRIFCQLRAQQEARGLVLSSTCNHLANNSTVGIVHMIAGFSSFKYVMVMVMTVADFRFCSCCGIPQ